MTAQRLHSVIGRMHTLGSVNLSVYRRALLPWGG
ncbi:MAG: hypothetical protein JWN04_5768 [Myxococcaceae bacterium]|nr:hypothetical protein [Myxococcaceae bacterium]